MTAPHHLRAVRLANGMTLRRLSELTDIDAAHLSRVERGQKSLSVESLHRVAVALRLLDLARMLEPYASSGSPR